MQITNVLTESGGDATLSQERTHIWCDFLSIAKDHRALQVMAVSALPMFSVSSDAFVVVAPPATHLGSGDTCNFDSYSLRGWCRAEVLSKICGDCLKRMFVLEEESHTISKLDMAVFHGNFSCCHLEHEHASVCDKETLMPAKLGLYSLIWLRGNKHHMEWVFEYINGAKDYFFPPFFTFKTRIGTEKRELFGPLVSSAGYSTRRKNISTTPCEFCRQGARPSMTWMTSRRILTSDLPGALDDTPFHAFHEGCDSWLMSTAKEVSTSMRSWRTAPFAQQSHVQGVPDDCPDHHRPHTTRAPVTAQLMSCGSSCTQSDYCSMSPSSVQREQHIALSRMGLH